MKILAPIDFSSSTEYALKYILELAIHTNGEIVLFNSNNSSPKGLLPDKKSELERIKNDFTSKGIKAHSHYSTGDFIHNLKHDILENYDIDLIVLTPNQREEIDSIFDNNSHTKKIIQSIKSNILVLNPKSGNIDFSKVLFTSNLELEERDAFKKFLDFLKFFPVEELHIMAVDTAANYFSQPTMLMKECLKEFKNIASDYNCIVKFFPEFTVQSGIIKYTELYDIKLISMSNYIKHPIKRLYTGSNIEKVVSESDSPVYIINKSNK